MCFNWNKSTRGAIRLQDLSAVQCLVSTLPSVFTLPMPVSKKPEPFAFESWCQKELARLLGFPVGDDLITYLTSIESKRDVQEYLDDLLGTDKKSSRDFQREFFARWHPPERPPVRPSKEEEELLTVLVRPKEEEMLLFSDKKSKKKEAVCGVVYRCVHVHVAVYVLG